MDKWGVNGKANSSKKLMQGVFLYSLFEKKSYVDWNQVMTKKNQVTNLAVNNIKLIFDFNDSVSNIIGSNYYFFALGSNYSISIEPQRGW